MVRNAESDLQRNDVILMVTIQPGLLPSHWQSSCVRLLLPSETWPKASVSRRLDFSGKLHSKGPQNSLVFATTDV